MVLQVDRFRLHRSLRRVLQAFRLNANCEIRIDTAFDTVIAACAAATRPAQTGTWIGPEMQAAYRALHRAGHAHSVETWVGGRLVAGLYCVAIGRAVFGESMFTHVTDGSKIALSALVALCRGAGPAADRLPAEHAAPGLHGRRRNAACRIRRRRAATGARARCALAIRARILECTDAPQPR
jgi:leucyl/phenylalanyl-tRNA--protein transferase